MHPRTSLSCSLWWLPHPFPPSLPHNQTWCRGKRVWESEALCLDCHKFSWRAYRDPDFKTPAQYEKEHWTQLVASTGV